MPMLVHELHPSVIHAPLILLPTAATVDILAASSSSFVRRRALDRAGRKLWWAGVGAAAFAGLTGMAASQEIHLEDERARDTLWLHGMGNFTILLGATGLALWRSRHRATAATAGLGAGAVGAALYTAWLGGELVYTHGAGVKTVPGNAQAPRLLSAAAPWAFLRDATRGLGWLVSRGARLAVRRQPLARGAAAAAASEPPPRRTPGGDVAFELRPHQ